MTDAEARLNELSAEVKDLERRRQDLLEQRRRGRTPADLEAAGRRLAAGAVVEEVDVDAELRRVETRLATRHAAVRALGSEVQRSELRRKLPAVRAALQAYLGHAVAVHEALSGVETAMLAADREGRAYEKLHSEVAALIDMHPDVVSAEGGLAEYRAELLRFGLPAEFRRERYGATPDRPTRETLPSGLDRWRTRARELEVDLKAGRR